MTTSLFKPNLFYHTAAESATDPKTGETEPVMSTAEAKAKLDSLRAKTEAVTIYNPDAEEKLLNAKQARERLALLKTQSPKNFFTKAWSYVTGKKNKHDQSVLEANQAVGSAELQLKQSVEKVGDEGYQKSVAEAKAKLVEPVKGAFENDDEFAIRSSIYKANIEQYKIDYEKIVAGVTYEKPTASSIAQKERISSLRQELANSKTTFKDGVEVAPTEAELSRHVNAELLQQDPLKRAERIDQLYNTRLINAKNTFDTETYRIQNEFKTKLDDLEDQGSSDAEYNDAKKAIMEQQDIALNNNKAKYNTTVATIKNNLAKVVQNIDNVDILAIDLDNNGESDVGEDDKNSSKV